ncbi:MAG: T9SS type A sorting domain-containing protein [Candidatus Sabulitectum sp.]|nr:T9SS type A sorting domain-containing protein [Candidatus Sabulitectum sp.]
MTMTKPTLLTYTTILLIAGASFAQWNFETVDSSVNVGWYSSIAIDPADCPHIAYLNAYNSTLKYARWSGNEWFIETVDTGVCPDELDKSISIALDSLGNPHIAYSTEHGNPGDTIRYACWDGSAWQKTDIVDSGYGLIWPSLALDSQDRPHVSWCNETEGCLKYARWDDSNWQITTVEEAFGAGYCNSLDLDSSDYPHISYIGAAEYLKYARWNGTNWETVTLDTVGYYGFEGIDTSIALDASDHPHIAYTHWISDDLKYAYFNGTDWQITTVDNSSITGKEPSIAVDSEEHPHISYRSTVLKYAHWTGSSWDILVLDEGGNAGIQNSIALGNLDNPHISYALGSSAILKHAWYGSSQEAETVSLPLQNHLAMTCPSPVQNFVTITCIFPGTSSADLAIYDIFGRCAANLINGKRPAGFHEIVWDCADMPNGVYVCFLKAGGEVLTRMLVISR